MAKSFVPETIQAQPKVRKLARCIWRLEMKMTKAKKMLTSLFIKLARLVQARGANAQRAG